ncbi:hypothetical protein [Nonomuraea sp. JJY05]|uniref:hypothetical protein n=1 Tax=Nonomuraea sp. JJY05 TaxID=3350255 RepID=UPI00373EBF09
MSITLPAVPAPAPPVFKVHKDPACPTCGGNDVTVLDDLNGGVYTACCQADPVAFTCSEAGVHVYLSPEGDEPEHCPHCPEHGCATCESDAHVIRRYDPRRGFVLVCAACQP